jgi:hypothetical protein
MRLLGNVEDARAKVLADIEKLLGTTRTLVSSQIRSATQGIEVLRDLRHGIYENLNQIQHENMILDSLAWLATQVGHPDDTVWSWNPRQTGDDTEPDLQGVHKADIIVSAEVTTSDSPKGSLDGRMRQTLNKLARMRGEKYYFVGSEAMRQRAQTKVDKADWPITVVLLDLPEEPPS